MEESIQSNETDILRLTAHKLSWDLIPAECVPKSIKRSCDELSAPKKPKSEMAKASMAATIPVMGSKQTAEGKVPTLAMTKVTLPPIQSDADHPMIVNDDSNSLYTNDNHFET